MTKYEVYDEVGAAVLVEATDLHMAFADAVGSENIRGKIQHIQNLETFLTTRVFVRCETSLKGLFSACIFKTVKSKWRQRDIKLYEHPTDETRVISVGVFWDLSEMIVCDEPKSAWRRELAKLSHNVVTE